MTIIQKQIDRKVLSHEVIFDKMRDRALIEFVLTIIDKLYEPMHSFQAISRDQRKSNQTSHNTNFSALNDFPGVGYYRLDFN